MVLLQLLEASNSGNRCRSCKKTCGQGTESLYMGIHGISKESSWRDPQNIELLEGLYVLLLKFNERMPELSGENTVAD